MTVWDRMRGENYYYVFSGRKMLATLLLIVTAPALIDAKWCVLDGRRYEEGETWHPELQPFGELLCVNCTCEAGNVSCTSEKCPRPDCEVPKQLPGSCCPTCDVRTEEGKERTTTVPGCHYNEEVYEDGDMFPSNSTGLRPTRENQCVMCSCTAGQVLCHLKTCLPMRCKKYTKALDDCCPKCLEDSDIEDYLDFVLSDPPPGNLTATDCLTVSGPRKNGTAWHPVIGPYGRMECILCRCLNGKVECSRRTCPADEDLPCRKPRYVPGECCKQCPPRRRDKNKNKGKKGKKGKKRRGKGKKNRKRDRKNGKKKADSSKTDSSSGLPVLSAMTSSGNGSLFESLCMPKRTDRLVYRMEGDGFLHIAIDVSTDNDIELLKWTVQKGRLTTSARELIPAADIRKTVQENQILGATNKRGYKRLKKRLQKKLARCKRPCRVRTVDRQLKRSRLKPVKFGDECRH